MIRCERIAITTDATGAGTATSGPFSGEVVSIRLPSADLAGGGSAIWTLTRQNDGGTILRVTSADGPWQYQPRDAAHTVTGGTTAYSAGNGPVMTHGVPVDSHVVCTVSQAGSAAGPVDVYVYLAEGR